MRSKYLMKILLGSIILVSLNLSVLMVLGEDEIRITEDGVVGSTDIVQDGDVFLFTSNIYSQIVVEVSNIIIDGGWDNGYSLQPTSSMNGIVINQRHNVIIRNTAILGAKNGIKLENSYDCSIEDCVISDSRLTGIRIIDCLERNIITGNEIIGAMDEGILLYNSTDTVIYGNSIEGIDGDGIDLENSNGNYIHGNTIQNIVYQALDLDHSNENILYENDCSGSFNNVYLFRSSDNHIIHNNFQETRGPHVDIELSENIWNEPYPSGGNYWHGYEGVDELIGVDQSQVSPTGDGIGDSPNYVNYIDDDENVDWFPLINLYIPRVSCTVYPSTVQRGDPVSVSGVLTPNPGIKEVKIIFSKPDGSTIERGTITDHEGSFSLPYTPNDGGAWSIKARWVGLSGYGGVTSESCSLQVTIPSVVPELKTEEVILTPTSLSIRTEPLNYDGNKVPRYAIDTYVWIKGRLSPAVEEASFSYQLTYPDDTIQDGTFSDETGDSPARDLEVNYLNGRIEVYLFKIKRDSQAGEYSVSVTYMGDSQHDTSTDVTTFKIEPGMESSRILPCIIATAAYGSEMHPDVLHMRSFRDEKVRSSFTGDNFVNLFHIWYYSWSPPIAELISQSNLLKEIFRIILLPLVYSMRISEAVFDVFSFIPEVASSLSILTSAMLCGVFYIAPLLIFLKRIGLKIVFNSKHLLSLGIVSLFFSTLGSIFESIMVNTLGFGVLAVLVSLSIGYKISKLIY